MKLLDADLMNVMVRAGRCFREGEDEVEVEVEVGVI